MFKVMVGSRPVFTGDWATLCAWLAKQSYPSFTVVAI